MLTHIDKHIQNLDEVLDSQTDHGKDIQVRGEVTRNAVHHNLSWEFQAAKNHRVPC